MLQGKDTIGELSKLCDEDLVACCKENQDAAYVLILRYAKFIHAKANAMAKRGRSSGVDAEDLAQEGLLGLLNAAKTFERASTSFSTYANVCITNKMTTALIKSNRNDIPAEIHEKVAEDRVTPESILIEKEKTRELDEQLGVLLSKREGEIFRLFLRGSTYDQMARQLNISPKTVDNALQRVRRKLKSVWRADHFSS